MKKLLKWSAIALTVLILLIVGFLLFGLNPVVKMGVIRGGTYATGQTTGLNSANLSLTGGTLQLSGLDIGNPTGYKSTSFLKMGDCKVTVQSSSLFTDTVIIDEIVISGLEVTIEQQGLKSNLAEILDHIQKQTSAGGSTTSESPGKKLSIHVIKLTGTKVQLAGIVNTSLQLGDIELKEPTNPDGRPMRIADVVGKVLITIAKQVMENPQIPSAFKDGLGNAQKMINDASKQIMEGGIKDAGKKIEDATKGLGDMFKKKN